MWLRFVSRVKRREVEGSGAKWGEVLPLDRREEGEGRKRGADELLWRWMGFGGWSRKNWVR